MLPGLTKSAINKLGERLARDDVPSDEDLRLLEQVRNAFDAAMEGVQTVLRERLHLKPNARLKTVTTLVEKLKRSKSRLSTVQDIAGLRVVQAMTLVEQDALVSRIAACFSGAQVVDRRAKPSQGYRAVHVLVQFEGLAAEIQVRTTDQHMWAQAMEQFADDVGRGVRNQGAAAIVGDDAQSELHRHFFALMQRASAVFASFECVEAVHAALRAIGNSETDLALALADVVQTAGQRVGNDMAKIRLETAALQRANESLKMVKP